MAQVKWDGDDGGGVKVEDIGGAVRIRVEDSDGGCTSTLLDPYSFVTWVEDDLLPRYRAARKRIKAK